MKQLSIKAKELKELITSGLQKKLSQDGFIFRKSINQFEKKIGDYTTIFNLLMTTWSDHFSIDVRLYISQKEIELIYETIVGKSHKLTIGNTIDRINASPDGREVINGNLTINLYFNEDIDAAVDSLERYYIQIAKPYFAKYQNLKAIDDIINNPPFNHCPADVGGSFDKRCMKGLIVARLINNPNYEQLVATYDEAIKETMDAESIENYHKVKEYLMYNRVN